MLARRPFIPSSVRVSRHTTENCVGQAGLNRLSKDLPGVKFDTNVIEDELKDLRQRASLLHAKQMLLRDPNNLELKQKVREMAQDLEGSTWATIRDLKMENASLKGRIRCASSQASTPRSPRAKQPESREQQELAVESSLQEEVAKLRAQNSRLRAKLGAAEADDEADDAYAWSS